jgi:hypothetical protein
MAGREIENLKIGDLVPNCFGKLLPIVSIFGRGKNTKTGKTFICFYQPYGNGIMSNTIREI